MAKPLVLVANPGSSSRKYAIFEGSVSRGSVHFEYFEGRVIATAQQKDSHNDVEVHFTDINESASSVLKIFRQQGILQQDESIDHIGLRIVAPGGYFLFDRIVDDEFVSALHSAHELAPIHITATLDELRRLREQFSDTQIAGISDSAFHITKPDYAWNYGLPLEDADRLDIKRFGYHGISVASVVSSLESAGKLTPRLVIAHLGSGASVTAIHGGKSIDTTMGFSPLEGLVMSTRSGTIDFTAVRALKRAFDYSDDDVNDYLNKHSGLLGLGGSNDIRELLRREANGDYRAKLALSTYVYSIQKAIGQMTAALGGIDMLVFTGTVGERSFEIRHRIMKKLHYLDISLEESVNNTYTGDMPIKVISRPAQSKPVLVIQAREDEQIVARTLSLS